LIADLLADALIRQGIVEPRPERHARRDRRWQEHLDSLDDLYFSKGQQRLEMLRCWTQGKAGAVRGEAQRSP
jgi:hypothetical protein